LPPAALFEASQQDDTGANMTEDANSSENSTGANMTEDANSSENSTSGNMTHDSASPATEQTEEDSDEETAAEPRGNEIYTVNGKAFEFMMNPIVLQTGKPYRIYVVNMLEFDLVNSFHLHGAMFDYYTAGTDETADYNSDIVTLSQGDRGIMEFTYQYPGTYMFHAHQTEFTDLGWMGLLDVRGDPVNPPEHNST
jgi:FtsP/CotA-like multicopper oxidase with cupredoxin domain